MRREIGPVDFFYLEELPKCSKVCLRKTTRRQKQYKERIKCMQIFLIGLIREQKEGLPKRIPFFYFINPSKTVE